MIEQDKTAALSPDLLVEEQILVALTKEGLIDEVLARKLKGKIASGSMSADDWRVDFELALSKKKIEVGSQP